MLLYLSMLDTEEDKLTFEKIYSRYHDDIFRRAAGFLSERADVEDVMQETWQTVCEKISFFREKDEASIKAYILKIARNKAVSLYRKNRKEAEILEYDDICEEEESKDSLLLSLCAEQGVEEIVECIKELDEIYSDILNLYFLNQNNVKEIALLMDLNENTVRTRLERGKKRLRDALVRRGLHD